MTKAMDDAFTAMAASARKIRRQFLRKTIDKLVNDPRAMEARFVEVIHAYPASHEERVATVRKVMHGNAKMCREGHWAASRIHLFNLRELYLAERYNELLMRAWRRDRTATMLAAAE